MWRERLCRRVRNRIVVVTIAAADAGVVRWPCVCAPAGTFRPSD